MDNLDTDDLLTGPGLEEPAIRRNLLPEWLKKLLLVLIFYKAYSLLRSFQLFLLLSTGNVNSGGGSVLLWIVFIALDLLEAFVYIALLRQWKFAPVTGIVVLSVSSLTTIIYFVRFITSPVIPGFTLEKMPSGLIIQGIISLISLVLSIVIIIRLLRIRRAWENGVAGK
jgi:hypothetical protein